MKSYPAFLLGLITGLLAGAFYVAPQAHADPPACVVGRDSILNNPVCRDCFTQHMFEMQICTGYGPPPAVNP